jgi:hypothetical protein
MHVNVHQIKPAIAQSKAVSFPPLYSAAQIGVAALIGGAVSGGILIAMNQVKLNQKAKAVFFAIGGLATTIGMIFVGLLLGENGNSIGLLIGLGVAFAVKAVATSEFATYYAIQSQTKRRISNWNVTGIVTVCLVIMMTVILYGVTMELI